MANQKGSAVNEAEQCQRSAVRRGLVRPDRANRAATTSLREACGSSACSETRSATPLVASGAKHGPPLDTCGVASEGCGAAASEGAHFLAATGGRDAALALLLNGTDGRTMAPPAQGDAGVRMLFSVMLNARIPPNPL